MLKKYVKESFILQYNLISMRINVSKPTPIFVENTSVLFNATNTVITWKKKTVALSYHFVRENVTNNVVEVRKLNTKEDILDPFTKPLVGNDFNIFNNECMVNE